MATRASSLEASVEATLSALRRQEQQWTAQEFTIFRVPTYVRESNRTAYEPRMVSIGPYYHGAAGLRAMEDHKWRYLHDFLARSDTVSSSLLIEEMRALESQARACYTQKPTLNSDDFLQMLLLDGCFILEFFFKWHTREPDAMCDVGWGLTLVTTDLLLLENQIPFFVVERLYHVVAGEQDGKSTEYLINLLVEYISDNTPFTLPSANTKISHLLHLYYECFVPKRLPEASASQKSRARRVPSTGPAFSQELQERATSTEEPVPPAALVIPCATEMRAAGVRFRRRSSERDMYDVKFDGQRGVMEIPGVVIDDIMKRPLLVNLIAFEQCQGTEEARVLTSYVSLMGMLIRTAQDVELLQRRGILDNLLANHEEAARFFSHLGEGGAMNYDQHVFAGLYEDVRRYCGSWYHRNRAILRRDYFGNPWSAISLFVAGLVVALTATQTYFTVFPRN
ncbi:hypothetical protein QOZ80_3AG0250670 [Eleusine coracana subsp. coracana]|nr:hypothetical protein QOZ80_3AG0250670 [Eleusine coracana subsp. coracana]